MSNAIGRSNHYSLPPRASPGPRVRSGMSPDTQTHSISTNDSSFDSPFQMMDIMVSVDIMEGLIMESKEKSAPSDSHKSGSSKMLGSLPITTFVSCKKNVSSTRTIATHVPSLPLNKPSSSHAGKLHHFLVRWPADFDPHGDALSTFKLSRLMKKEPSASGSIGFGFVPEEVELTIGLMRGSEMITLGLANLVITGEETEEMIIDLPINITKEAVKETQKKNRRRSASPLRKLRSPIKSSSKAMKPKAFPSDSKRRYRLSEQSMIRLQVQITPKANGYSSYEGTGTSISQYADNSDYTPETESTHFAEISNFGPETVSSQLAQESEYGPQDLTYESNYSSAYAGNSARLAPMDELRDDLHTQGRSSSKTRRRIFGKEIPSLTQDYICGSSDYGGSTPENAYDTENDKSRVYDQNIVPKVRDDRDYYPTGVLRSNENQNMELAVYVKDISPPPTRKMQMVSNIPRSSSTQRSSNQRSSSTQRSSNQRSISAQRSSIQRSSSTQRSSIQRSSSTQRSRSRQRSSSRHRSSSRTKSRLQDPNTNPDSRLYDPNEHTSRNLDENRRPGGLAKRYPGNVPGHFQDSSAPPRNTKIVHKDTRIQNNKSRPRSKDVPPRSRSSSSRNERYAPPKTSSFDGSEYYYEKQQYYDDENKVHNEMVPTRRVPSFR